MVRDELYIYCLLHSMVGNKKGDKQIDANAAKEKSTDSNKNKNRVEKKT